MKFCDLCGSRLHHTTYIDPVIPYTGYKCPNQECKFPIGSKYPVMYMQAPQKKEETTETKKSK